MKLRLSKRQMRAIIKQRKARAEERWGLTWEQIEAIALDYLDIESKREWVER
jgi:hypothetical protein